MSACLIGSICVSVSVTLWVERRTSDREVTGSTLTRTVLCKNFRQVVHVRVPLSPSSITWYQTRASDALSAGKVIVGLVESNGSHLVYDWVTSGLTAKRPGSASSATLVSSMGLPYFTICLCVCMSVSVCVGLCVSVCLCESVSLSVCVSHIQFLAVNFCTTDWKLPCILYLVCLCVSLYFSVCLCVCLFVCLSVCHIYSF